MASYDHIVILGDRKCTLLRVPMQLGRVKALHGCFRGYISDVIYLAIRGFVSHKGIYLD